LAMSSIMVCSALASAGPVVFDFENQASTDPGAGGEQAEALTTLALQQGGLGLTISRQGESPFDIVDRANIGNGSFLPLEYGQRSLSGFADIQSSSSFLFVFDQVVSSFSVSFGNNGDTEQDPPVILQAFSDASFSSSQLVAQSEGVLPTKNEAVTDITEMTLTVTGEFQAVLFFGITLSSTCPSDCPPNYNNFYFDNIVVSAVPAPGMIGCLVIAGGLVSHRRR
jgi:hypothetical protein